MRTYEVKMSGEIAGTWRSAGDRIPLTAAQARYLAPPLASIVEIVKEAANDGFSRRKRRDGKTSNRLGACAAVDQESPDDEA